MLSRDANRRTLRPTHGRPAAFLACLYGNPKSLRSHRQMPLRTFLVMVPEICLGPHCHALEML